MLLIEVVIADREAEFAVLRDPEVRCDPRVEVKRTVALSHNQRDKDFILS